MLVEQSDHSLILPMTIQFSEVLESMFHLLGLLKELLLIFDQHFSVNLIIRPIELRVVSPRIASIEGIALERLALPLREVFSLLLHQLLSNC